MTRLAAGPEFDLISRFVNAAHFTHPLIRVGPGDDCAIVADFALSIDASVENVHFRRDWLNPQELGWRATSAALSDLAAVAAEPVAVLVTLALTKADVGEYAESVMRGAIAAAESVGASVVGGDVASSNLLMVDVLAMGKTEKPVLRSTARIGDEVWVTGVLGGSATAVSAWSRGAMPSDAARARYARPHPRTREAIWLRKRGVLNSMIDLSDGLYGDLQHIAAASNYAILIEQEAVPFDRQAGASYAQAVSGGEDYELAFTASRGSVRPLQQEFVTEFNLPLTRIGEVVAGSGVQERRLDGTMQQVNARGFQHFGNQSP